MRTVHEGESAKASEHSKKKDHPPASVGQASPSEAGTDPAGSKVPKSLKLHFNKDKSSAPSTPGAEDADAVVDGGPLSPGSRDALLGHFPDGTMFENYELALNRRDLFSLLRRQIRWAEEEGAVINEELKAAEEHRQHEWLRKELVLENLMEAEVAHAEARGDFKDPADLVTELAPVDASIKPSHLGRSIIAKLYEDDRNASALPLIGREKPWYRQKPRSRRISEGALGASRPEPMLIDNPPSSPPAALADIEDERFPTAFH